MYHTIREFVEALEAAGELKRITADVSPILEIAEIADRTSKSQAPFNGSTSSIRNDPAYHDRGGYALLFENVKGSKIPVLINAFGSYRRMEFALGCNGDERGIDDGHTSGGFDGIAQMIADLIEPKPPASLREGIALLKKFAPLASIGPKKVRDGRCQEVLYLDDAVDLNVLPIIKCWPHDGDYEALGYPGGINARIPGVEHANEDVRGRFITLAGIYTVNAKDADDISPGLQNIGTYRVQQLGKDRMAMHWHMHHDGAAHWRSWKKLGKPMPVAIALGGESVLPYASTAPLPPGISEVLMAGFLNRKGIRFVKAKTVPLYVPANAEIVIEGFVSTEAGMPGWDPRETDEPLGTGAVFEGPFGDHTGFYSMPDRSPILEVTAITHARDAIYPTTIVGLPPQEDYFLGKATERIFLPLLKTLIHDLEDYDLPLAGAFHNWAAISIDKAYPLQARRVMHSVWGAGQMAWTKCVTVVDKGVDVHDVPQVLSALATNCDPHRDIEFVNGPLDILDHAAPRLGAGVKMGFDGTVKMPDEAIDGRPIESRRLMSPAQRDLYLAAVKNIEGVVDASLPDECARGWLFVSIEKAEPGAGAAMVERLAELSSDAPPPFTIVLKQGVDVRKLDEALFHWLANTAPERDMVRTAIGVGFDATAKSEGDERHGKPVRPWPSVLEMDERTKRTVDSNWRDYFPDYV